MSELHNKRPFTHDGYSYTISTRWMSDDPLTYQFIFDRSHGDPIEFEHVGDRTYAFEEAEHGHAFAESDVLIANFQDYLEATIKRGEQPPDVLPDDWMSRRSVR